MSVNEVVHTYIAAWHEPAEDKRRNLLAQSWAEDGQYSDPQNTYLGDKL